MLQIQKEFLDFLIENNKDVKTTVRLNKAISIVSGISRREADKYIIDRKVSINGDLITNNNTLDTGDNPIGKGSIETAPGANITAGGNIRADKIILTDTLGEEYYIEYSQWGLFANPCSDIGGCS